MHPHILGLPSAYGDCLHGMTWCPWARDDFVFENIISCNSCEELSTQMECIQAPETLCCHIPSSKMILVGRYCLLLLITSDIYSDVPWLYIKVLPINDYPFILSLSHNSTKFLLLFCYYPYPISCCKESILYWKQAGPIIYLYSIKWCGHALGHRV